MEKFSNAQRSDTASSGLEANLADQSLNERVEQLEGAQTINLSAIETRLSKLEEQNVEHATSKSERAAQQAAISTRLKRLEETLDGDGLLTRLDRRVMDLH